MIHVIIAIFGTITGGGIANNMSDAYIPINEILLLTSKRASSQKTQLPTR